MQNRVIVKVPASTSNLGSGFDTLGLAVSLYVTVEAQLMQGTGGIVVHEQSENFESASVLIREAAALLGEFRNLSIQIRTRSEVPPGCGLGASAALRLGTIAALTTILGRNLSPEELLALVYRLELHPDNASPSIYGGFTVSGMVQDSIRCVRFEVDPKLKVVTLFTGFPLETKQARSVLPTSYSREDTAHSLNRAALIASAFASRNYWALKGTFDDRLHQPYRSAFIPQLNEVILAGEEAGAIGGFLSGAGSSIICLALEKAEVVADAMRQKFGRGRVAILSPSNEGFRYETS